ncbi:MAG: hypothetical protein IH947_15855 [Bacteroidetes bacterium]|nr:hypothetical protein [Bacteroidota bacterium]
MDRWNSLPKRFQTSFASKVISAFLEGTLYPIGAEQLDLAIELAEAGTDAATISKLTRLDQDVFKAFLK